MNWPAWAGFQRDDVVDGFEAAGSDHRDLDRIGERAGELDIDALLQAVAGNIGDDQSGDARILKALGHIDGGQFGLFVPALQRYFAVAGIKADGNLLWVFARGGFDEIRIAHSGGAEDHPCCASVEPVQNIFHAADAAADLHWNARH